MITCVNIFLPIIFHTKNALTKLTIFCMNVLNFLAPSSPKILPTILSAPSTSVYPKSTKEIRPCNTNPAPATAGPNTNLRTSPTFL